MTKVFLLLNELELADNVKNILSDYDVMESDGEFEDVLTQLNNFMPDIVLINSFIDNCEFVLRQIKSVVKSNNTQILLFLNDDKNIELMNLSDGLIQIPFNREILLSTIQSHFKIKKSLDRLYENNKELSRSLYQLNVLYNTSSQFAGTLNTKKLYEIMLEAMEKTLSFDISSVLIIPYDSQAVFNVSSICSLSENLVDALKIRSILNHREVNHKSSCFNYDDLSTIKVVQNIKQTRSNKMYGIEAVNFDSLFAPIKVGEDFFAIVELFRQTPFSAEDVTCFQAITHQVALPLRSAKLYEEISKTNKKLEKLEKLKSEFVSIVSHELRTPLTPINNSLEIVLSGQAGQISPDTENFISMAKRNIQRLSGIIEDLLDLSRIQTGKLDFKYKTVDITPSIELLYKTFAQVAADKKIDINLDIKDKLPQIYADVRRIEQILTNLVSNSLKFTSQGGKISIQACKINSNDIPQDELVSPVYALDGEYIKITVSDSGVGIKKEDIPRIFDKFSQIESSLNRNKGGVGLGLTITKQLIDSHLGAIRVVSEEKKGSSFEIYLPIYDLIKTFEMDLSHILISNEETGVLRLKYKNPNLINLLKENKILNLTRLSKEADIPSCGYRNYYTFIPRVSLSSFDAICSTIKDYCANLDDDSRDIMLVNLHSSKASCDAHKIVAILNNWKD